MSLIRRHTFLCILYKFIRILPLKGAAGDRFNGISRFAQMLCLVITSISAYKHANLCAPVYILVHAFKGGHKHFKK